MPAVMTYEEAACLKTALAAAVAKRRLEGAPETTQKRRSRPPEPPSDVLSHCEYIRGLALNATDRQFAALVTHLATQVVQLEDPGAWLQDQPLRLYRGLLEASPSTMAPLLYPILNQLIQDRGVTPEALLLWEDCLPHVPNRPLEDMAVPLSADELCLMYRKGEGHRVLVRAMVPGLWRMYSGDR